MLKKLIIITFLLGAFFIFPQAVCAETIVNGDVLDISVAGEYIYESDSPAVASVNEDGLVKAKSEGETKIHVREKKLFWKSEKKEIPIKVVNGGAITVKPIGKLTVSPKLTLLDSEKNEIKEFSPNNTNYLAPGTYYVGEKTKYSSFHENPHKVDLMVGDSINLTTSFTNTATLTFELKGLSNENVTIWKKTGNEYKEYKTVKVKNGEKIEIRSGNYAWSSLNGKATAHVTVGEKEIYPFSVGDNPLALVISSESSLYEAVSLSENTQENAKIIYEKLMAAGVSPICASAIIGNMYGESGIRTSAIENGGGGHGLCQWTGGRWQNLKSYADSVGKEWTDVGVQVDFLIKELNGYNMDTFWGSKSVEEATEIFMRKFERPAEWVYATSLPKRIGAAKRIYSLYAH